MQKKVTTNKQAKVTKAQAKAVEAPKKDLIAEITDAITKASEADKNVRMQKVTGYTTVKYANKVLFELHTKKRSISHITFSSKQTVLKMLKENKLVHRIVPKSYGWKFDTECLIDTNFNTFFPAILKSVVEEAVAERALRQKATEKKVAKKA